MRTILHEGKSLTVDAQIADVIEGLQGKVAALSAILGDRNALAAAADTSARAAQAALIDAERRMRDPNTPLGAYIQRTERAYEP